MGYEFLGGGRILTFPNETSSLTQRLELYRSACDLSITFYAFANFVAFWTLKSEII